MPALSPEAVARVQERALTFLESSDPKVALKAAAVLVALYSADLRRAHYASRERISEARVALSALHSRLATPEGRAAALAFSAQLAAPDGTPG
jgi:hypothetical protein